MRLRIHPRLKLQWCSLNLAWLATAGLQAQTADDYFHGGAMSYLSNNIPVALEVVTNGLQRFPEDQKLKRLYELLNQQQQQNQQEQQQNQKDQQKEQQQDQYKQDDQKQQEQQQDKKEDQSKSDQQKPEQQQAGDKSKQEEKPKEEKDQQMIPHEMTPQEAKQLLDAQKGDEQVLSFQPQSEPKKREKKLKDW